MGIVDITSFCTDANDAIMLNKMLSRMIKKLILMHAVLQCLLNVILQ